MVKGGKIATVLLVCLLMVTSGCSLFKKKKNCSCYSKKKKPQ